MVSTLSSSCVFYHETGISRSVVTAEAKKSHFQDVKIRFWGSLVASIWPLKVGFNDPRRKRPILPFTKCKNSEKGESSFKDVSVEPPPYHCYFDSTSGELQPASGARASIPGQEYWPEGTASRVRAARAPEPTGVSSGSPSYGKKPGSRRKKYKASASASESVEATSVSMDPVETETSQDLHDESKEPSSEYVSYQTEPEGENLSEYEMDKNLGRPHPFIDPKAKKPIEDPLTCEELWWNWRKPEMEQWSRWQRRHPDVETVFLKAMAETGQVKLYGDHPTLTETSLY